MFVRAGTCRETAAATNGLNITRSVRLQPDLALLTTGDHGNCYAGSSFGTWFSLIGALPACP